MIKSDHIGRTEKLRDIAILVMIAGFIIMWNLGTGSLLTWDECLYAQVSKEMLHSHNYIDMTWAGGRWNDKPPLYIWMTVIFYKLFGIGEFSARLFSALCGIGTVIVTYLLASKLYFRRSGLAAALILISTYHFVWGSKVGMLDVALTFFISLSLYWFALGTERKIYLFFSMLAFGCAFMTKSLAAAIVPATLLLYIVCAKKYRIFKEPALWAGILITALIVGSWHLVVFLHYKKDFIAGYLISHLILQGGQVVDGHQGSIFTYFKTITNKGRPWGMLIFLAIPFALWEIFKKKGETKHILPLAWIFATMALFTAVRTKLNWYIIPIYPAISILIGWWIDKVLKKKTVIVIFLCCAASLLYLTVEKHIFNLDYSHGTKEMALSLEKIVRPGEKVYICDGDPSVRFYFLNGKAIASDPSRIESLLREKNCYIVFNKKVFNSMKRSRLSVILESPEFVVIKID